MVEGYCKFAHKIISNLKDKSMTRDAKIFDWKNTDWKPLELRFKRHEDFTLQDKVAIYQTFDILVPYAIVSISAKVIQ